MRVFHTSDTHLGFQQFTKTDEHGLNQREQDVAAAWHRIIDLAVAEKPDLFLHAGDLFDGVRPGNRALAHAMEGFLALSRAGIPTVIVAGNHEHPRLRETGSPFRLFAHLPNIHVVYQGIPETIEVSASGQLVRVHAIPQLASNEELAAAIAAIPSRMSNSPSNAPDSPGAARPTKPPTGHTGLDILLVHGAVHSLAAFSHAEFNELTLDASWFDDRFDYVALGHYHGVQQVADRAWYCGAPERVSIAEAGQEKGFLDVEITRGSATATFRALPTRVMADASPIAARGMDAATVLAEARSRLAQIPAGAVARLRIRELDPALRGGLDVRTIQKEAQPMLHLDLRLEWQDLSVDVRGEARLLGVTQEWDHFFARQVVEGIDRDRITARAKALLEGP